MPAPAQPNYQITRLPDYTISRVVSLQPSATATVAALGVLDRLVACTRYCADVCSEVRGRAIVADSWTAQANEILAAHPDLVIASVPYQAEAVAQILKAGVRFLGLAPRCLEDVYGDIAAIASLLGLSERGKEVIAGMQRAIAEVSSRIPANAPRPRVFCEIWGKPIMAAPLWVKELVVAAGGEFLGEPGQQWIADAIRNDSPDVIVTAWCGAGDRVPLEKIIGERGWEQLPAAAGRRVYCVSDELLNTPGPTLIGGLHALAAAIHPEVFPSAAGLRRTGV